MSSKPRKPIGVRINDYRRDVRGGLRLASAQAFAAVELDVGLSEVAPEQLSESGRRHVARIVANTGMGFASLACDAAGGGLADAARIDGQIARSIATLRMAADMHVPIVTHDAGEFIDLPDAQRDRVAEALRVMAEEAERLGTVLAVRSRLADPQQIATLIRAVDCPLVRVSVDPGAMLMSGFDPVEALATFGDAVSIAYVRDAVRGTANHAGRETALGTGSLDLPAYLASLSVSGCHAPPIVRREDAADPATSIAADKDALERQLP
jgi:sugar phosphate isomerase/epimerase